jgi:hypothetical protein
MPSSTNRLRPLALGVALAMLLAGCSEYFDRRDTISLNGGDAVATNKVTMMVDPWPRESANKRIAFNGDKMEGAIARYRSGRVIQPHGTGTSSSYSNAAPAGAPANTSAPVGPTITQGAAH